jgi:Plasma-membrane choline transporter
MVDLSVTPTTAYADGKSEDGDSNSSQLDAAESEIGNKLTPATSSEQGRIHEESATPIGDESGQSGDSAGKVSIPGEAGNTELQIAELTPCDVQPSNRQISLSEAIITLQQAYDTRDEEEDDTLCGGRWPADDPYVYSDDSASLSDAYFFPQNDDIGPLIGDASQNQSHQYPLANYYGSMSSSSNHSNSSHSNYLHASQSPIVHGMHYGANEQRAPSPLWITAGSIQEDAEEVFPLKPFASLQFQSDENLKTFLISKPRQEKRRQRRSKRGWSQQQQREQIQREKQAEREKLVNQVRGRPQNSKARDVVWAYMFLIQFACVCFCAFYFARKFVIEDSSMNWTFYLPNPVANSNFHRFTGDSQVADNRRGTIIVDSVKPAMPVLIQNTKTEELQYNENLLQNETAVKKLPLTTVDVVSSLSEEASGKAESTHISTPHPIDYQNVVALLSVTGFYACVVSYASFLLMLLLSRAVIQIMLVFSVVLALSWGMIGLSLDPYGAISILGFTSLLLTLGYSMFHWQRVPFAATNLNTALSALRCTVDVACLGFGGLVVSFAWSMTWTVAFIGVVNTLNSRDCEEEACHPRIALNHVPVYIILFISYHWTNTVIKNVLRVTISTLIGTWWFYPRDIGYCCTAAVAKPLFRSLTLSFGSLCCGSLLVQPAQVITMVANCFCCKIRKPGSHIVSVDTNGVHAKSENQVGRSLSLVDEDDRHEIDIGLCSRVASWCSGFVSASATFNRWSYTYIGMCKYLRSDICQLLIRNFLS